MQSKEIQELCMRHSLYTWKANRHHKPIPIVDAKGVYLIDADGNRILDWNSQAMSVHVGHGHPKMVQAISDQAQKLPFVAAAFATEIRARLSKKLADICPGHLNTFLYVNGGAEANENAVRAARAYSGRHKILSRYRSYHGATSLTLQLTGDPRRIYNEPGPPGHIRVMDPFPYDYSFGKDDQEIVDNHLIYLKEIIKYEGPDTIAAMMLEPIPGTNGILIPPKGYLKKLKALLDEYGILMICDEVMTGFGRTGKLFGFMHDDVVPDIVCMAKGITSSYLPFGAVALSDAIAEHFQDNVFWGGLTYNSHPMGCAAALANIEIIEDEGLVDNSRQLGAVMASELDRLQEKHPSVKATRSIGLFGIAELQQDSTGTPMAPYNGTSEPMQALAAAFRSHHLYALVRWFSFFCIPPLCISEEQLRAGFAIVDKALDVTDALMSDAPKKKGSP